MNEELEQKILNKKSAVSSDAYLAKRHFDAEKEALSELNVLDDDYDSDLKELRHELKLMMALFSESKFDDIIHLIANPSRLMGLNFIIGFFRGLGFSIAVLVIILILLASFSNSPLSVGF
ncbi:MAG: hypothetical protein VW397_02580 [Candidatus Margulisiibacteriota bacterium]